MKRVAPVSLRCSRVWFGLALLIVCAIAPTVRAQTSIGLYSDKWGETCSFTGNAPGYFTAYVVVRPDLLVGVKTVQFTAPPPACLGAVYAGETVPAGMIAVGNSQTGISIVVSGCYVTPVSVLEIKYWRSGSTEPCCPYSISPHPETGQISATDCAGGDLSVTSVVSRFNADPSCECIGNSPPAPPSFPTPPDGATGASLVPALTWVEQDLDNNITQRDLYFGTDPSPPLLAAGLDAAEYSLPRLEEFTQYYWRVVVRDELGEETSGPVWSFTTRADGPPLAPHNPKPGHAENDVGVQSTLSWQCEDPDGDPIVYDVYFGTSPSPSLVAAGLTQVTYAPGTLEFNTTYYWRVVAHDDHGFETSGPVWTFATRPENYPPDVPYAPSPADNALSVLINTALSWWSGDRDGDPLTFDVYFGASTPPPLVATNVAVTTFAPGVLEFSTAYYWRIVAHDDSGAETSGPTWKFTTRPANLPPNAPNNPSPASGSSNRPLNQTLTWQCTDPDGDPLTFDVYFGTSAPPPLVASNIAVTSYTPGPLQISTNYFWRIVARDVLGTERTGPEWWFTTRGNQPPYLPSNPSPPNNATNRSVLTTLSWVGGDPNGDAVTYDVYLGTSDPPPLVAQNLNTLMYQPPRLEFLTTYYWRIVARDVFGATTTGLVWNFRTTAGSPPTIFGPYPPNTSLTVESPILTWSATDPDGDPLVHTVYLGTANPPPVVAVGLTEPAYDPSTLPPATYFWRIMTFDGRLTTTGPVWTFTLGLPGDPTMDGVVNVADAECVMQIFLWNPACGGAFGYELGNVNCDQSLTPGDARCIHKFVVDGSCPLCGPTPVASESASAAPLVSAGPVFTRDDTLVVHLSVGAMQSLGAFGLVATADPKLKFLKAQRCGLTQNFDVLETSTPNPGMAVVGAYSLAGVPAGSGGEFLELQFDMSNGLPPNLVLGGFVDDLYGAGNVVVSLDGVVSAQPIETGLALHPNRPNPFNPQTTISYSLPSRARVRVTIVDASGRIVQTLVNAEQSGGTHEVRWEGKGTGGEAVASGVYFCVLDVGGERRIGKLVLLK